MTTIVLYTYCMSVVSSPRKECSWDAEKGVHNDSIHYRDQLYQFRALASKESSSSAFPMSLIASEALHCHPSSALIRAWAQFTSLSSASKRGELHKEHSYRAMFKPSTGGLTALCQMGFAVPFIPSGKTRSQQMKICPIMVKNYWGKKALRNFVKWTAALQGNLTKETPGAG